MNLPAKIARFLKKKLGVKKWLTDLAKIRTGLEVLDGPFRGMKYVHRSYNAAYLPKLIGCYEREITPVIEEAVSGAFDAIIDVGSAEGYFAVGMATRCETPVTAFEMHDRARRLSLKLADANGVGGEVDFRGECNPAELQQALESSARPFVLIDVEGYEAVLLDQREVPALAGASILVEVHEFARPGITAELFRRFGETHEIEVIWQDSRSPEEYPFRGVATSLVTKRMIRKAIEEERSSPQSWLWMRPQRPAVALRVG